VSGEGVFGVAHERGVDEFAAAPQRAEAGGFGADNRLTLLTRRCSHTTVIATRNGHQLGTIQYPPEGA